MVVVVVVVVVLVGPAAAAAALAVALAVALALDCNKGAKRFGDCSSCSIPWCCCLIAEKLTTGIDGERASSEVLVLGRGGGEEVAEVLEVVAEVVVVASVSVAAGTRFSLTY